MSGEKLYYAGIDGGGTKTCIAAADEQQRIVYRASGGPINIYGIGAETARSNLFGLLRDALDALRADRFETVVIGSAGISGPEGPNPCYEWEGSIPAGSVKWRGDLEIALSAVDGDNKAAIVSGTGSMLMALCDGRQWAVGGYGHLIGDEGSAYDIASRGIRAAVRYYEGWGAETALYDGLLHYYEVDSPKTLIDKIYCENPDKGLIAGFSRVVAQAAGSGDKTAKAIMESAADSLMEQFIALDRKSGGSIGRVSLSGGVLTPGSITGDSLRAALERYRPGLVVTGAGHEAVVGALRLCFDPGSYRNDLA